MAINLLNANISPNEFQRLSIGEHNNAEWGGFNYGPIQDREISL